MRQKQTFTIALLLLLFVTACQTDPIPTEIAAPQPTCTNTMTATATATALPLATRTPPLTPPTLTPLPTETLPVSTPSLIYTATKESMVVPSATLKVQPTPTLALIPTVAVVEEELLFDDVVEIFKNDEALFQELMVTNGGCDLPCWWSVKLGDSLEDTTQTFNDLGLPWLEVTQSYVVESDQMGVLSAGYANYSEHEQGGVTADYRLAVDMEFHELNGSVEYIYIDIDRIRFEQSQQEFIRDWEQYYLSSFLQKYGKPDQVYFRIRSIGDLMLVPQFSLSLLYREQGLAITYHIEGKWLDESYAQAEVCLDIENVRSLELSLFNPDGFSMWGYQFAPYHDELYEPLTWDAGMVYEIYQHPENLDCLAVP